MYTSGGKCASHVNGSPYAVLRAEGHSHERALRTGANLPGIALIDDRSSRESHALDQCPMVTAARHDMTADAMIGGHLPR